MSAKEMSMDRKIINQIKALGIDMIQESGSGHPGIVLGAATTLYTVYAKCLNFKKDDPLWINRDRFVMSSGHGSALLYATLYMAGVIPSISQIRIHHTRASGILQDTGCRYDDWTTRRGICFCHRNGHRRTLSISLLC